MDTQSIFQDSPPPNCNVSGAFYNLLNTLIRQSAYTRSAIVDRLNDSLYTEKKIITERDLNEWLAPSTEKEMPAIYLPAFCFAVGSIDGFEALLSPLMYRPVDKRTEGLAQIKALKQKAKEVNSEIKMIRDTLLGAAE